jgi:hypothetical protein
MDTTILLKRTRSLRAAFDKAAVGEGFVGFLYLDVIVSFLGCFFTGLIRILTQR